MTRQIAFQYVGGKSGVFKHLFPDNQDLPSFERYYEPFVGGGAVFFYLARVHPSPAWISDTCPNVINTLIQIRDNHVALTDLCIDNGRKFHDRRAYWCEVRDGYNDITDPLQKAAAFIFLQNFSLYSGRGAAILPAKNARMPRPFQTLSDALQNADISLTCFRSTPIRKNSLYYFDPPFFGQYHTYSTKFDLQDHYDLKLFCDKVNKKGSYFILSLGHHKVVQSLYDGYHLTRIARPPPTRSRGRGLGRMPTDGEVIVRNFKS